MELQEYLDYAKNLINIGGPNPDEYEDLTSACHALRDMNLSTSDVALLHEVLKPILDIDSVFGFAFLKPHGYSGDFEMINRIYQQWTSPDSTKFHKWDGFFHHLDSATAVRNRKQYLINQLNQLTERKESPRVLNLASGPCSDLYEFFSTNEHSENLHVDCLDMDKNAIEFGSTMCDRYWESITFINKNAFRYRPTVEYDLIWSAGLFDYFSDKLFIRLLQNMYSYLAEDGKLVIGNFSNKNTTRGVMEIIGQWYLHHRSESDLIEIGIKAGIPKEKINIFSEETGVNLFLHADK